MKRLIKKLLIEWLEFGVWNSFVVSLIVLIATFCVLFISGSALTVLLSNAGLVKPIGMGSGLVEVLTTGFVSILAVVGIVVITKALEPVKQMILRYLKGECTVNSKRIAETTK